MRIELTIADSYLPGWCAADGIRELVTNALDAAVDTGQEPKIVYRAKRCAIELTNPGATLTRDALLLGNSTKRDRGNEFVGLWGEGLKLGTLALLKAGRGVTFYTPTEVWSAAIEESRQFPGQQVLVFHTRTRKGLLLKPSTTVDITGISADEWHEIRQRFLLLCPAEHAVKTTRGTLILDQTHAGRLYVKGVFVEKIADLSYGYDLKDCELDRDRRMTNRGQALVECAHVWNAALEETDSQSELHTELQGRAYELFSKGAHDVSQVSYAWRLSALAPALAAQHALKTGAAEGEKPVIYSLTELGQAEGLGVSTPPVTRDLAYILKNYAPSNVRTLESVLEQKRESVTTTHEPHELAADELDVFHRAVNLLKKASPIAAELSFVVADLHDDTRGLCRNGVCYVNRPELKSLTGTIRVLAHEIAHGVTGHGHSLHQNLTAEEILASVIGVLLGGAA